MIAAALTVWTTILMSSPSALLGFDDEGFVPLFNGKDLEGWITPNLPGLFTVEDGVIVGRTDGTLKKNEFLVTRKRYGDFILKADVKLVAGNSGIQFRSERADDGAVTGPQADVAEGYWGLLYEERRRGILDRSAVERAKTLVKPDDYNQYVITAKGNHVVITLNGETVIDRRDPEFQADGVIALQVHVGPPMEVRFKNLLIKELP
ncbi:protein of unknown function DUF1080 [Isosphaera pallida ATCC 43644]|jgi:hypothetical protein|uniref:3-keto-alpha-glucoside-1,2-lyase/3-keto-2-hydroxy-glucal hydratase domain-containing protein n=1 Tax=Isosphaera pallida (strain ATCC 43644 / DSM 9630 / IS1B) TaxID=575540 RepID=E8QZ83_ISOPI|nr:DUF1080 domain-containing protein [Isosphaera pallida]ADV64212.1 protein of unknown function DUF1080 [Isosphaera pallida ATCC 43644]